MMLGFTGLKWFGCTVLTLNGSAPPARHFQLCLLPIIWILWDAPPKKPRDTFSGKAVYQRVGNSLSKV